MNEVFENEFIENLAGNFKRTPLQQNRLQESDAELINIPGSNIIIALTTDSIVEEIEIGLYSDPYLIGWMTVIVNVSDLAAVGAKPIGILLNETLPFNLDIEFLKKLQNGIQDACLESNIYVLGGDTNFSSSMQMSASAIGFIQDGLPLTRVGCKPGDYFFSSGKLGQGSSYAFHKLSMNSNNATNSMLYKPKARLREGQLLRKYASSCIDTSDGLLPALDQLMRLNKIGFSFETGIDEIIHPETREISIKAEIPLWMMLAGPHGEFELIFTVQSTKVDSFLKSASSIGWKPCKLGKVTKNQELQLLLKERYVTIETTKVRNLFNEVEGNIEKYITELFKLDKLLAQD